MTTSRSEPTERILSRKRLSGLTWSEIAARIGNGSSILITAALLGQMRLAPEQAARAAELLDLGEEERLLLQEVPSRGTGTMPADPLIYRVHKLVQVTAGPGRS